MTYMIKCNFLCLIIYLSTILCRPMPRPTSPHEMNTDMTEKMIRDKVGYANRNVSQCLCSFGNSFAAGVSSATHVDCPYPFPKEYWNLVNSNKNEDWGRGYLLFYLSQGLSEYICKPGSGNCFQLGIKYRTASFFPVELCPLRRQSRHIVPTVC